MKRELTSEQRQRRLAGNRTYNAAHRQEQKEYSRAYYYAHREERIAKKLAYDRAHPEKKREKNRRYKQRHPGKMQRFNKESRARLRLKVLSAYGGRCACCGETRLEFLALDHVNGGGGRERRLSGMGHSYLIAQREGFPDRFQVLCHNCNMAKGFYGRCPHEAERDNQKTPM